MARHLLAEHPTYGNVSRWLDAASLPVPEGVRDVIGRRLSRLSPAGSRLLEVAAVAGREFRLDVVQTVAGIADDDLEGVLHEAVRAAVVEERTATGPVVTYRFTHALFRQTLYEELLAPRRIRLHQRWHGPWRVHTPHGSTSMPPS
jgi:predicted ATPase